MHAYDEELEELVKRGIPDASQACTEIIPVCKGLSESQIPKPTVLFQAPKHPKDIKTASKPLESEGDAGVDSH